MIFGFFLSFVILQRLSELFIAKRNEKILKSKGAVEYDEKGYKYIVAMHILFFICLIFEKMYFNRELNSFSVYLFGLFLIAQILRYWAITTLGVFWNTRIIILPGSSLIKKGPYTFLNHPNYIAVVTELAVIPLIFSCYITAIIFSVLNLIVLSRRKTIEEKALKSIHS